MSAAKKETGGAGKTFLLTGPWAGAWKIFLGVGVLGLAGAGAGFASDPRRFAFSWLFGFMVCLTIALGAIFFVLIQRLTSAGWSVTVRRTAEFFALGVIPLAALFVPVLVSMDQLFPWLHIEHGAPAEHGTPAKTGGLSIITPAYAQDHAAPAAAPAGPAGHAAPAMPAAHGDPGEAAGHAAPADHAPAAGHAQGGHAAHGPMGDPHELIEKEILQKKAPYLNRTFFLIRVGIYFIVWILIATRLFSYSSSQDKSKDPKLTLAAQGFAPVATFLYAITLTGAAVDWVMSLEPTWFSTIFGVVIFACGVVSSLATMILVTLALRKSGPLQGAVTVEHYHDLGKLMFGFTAFWAYVSFSQFMLIWYAALPEETTFYHNRWDYEPWGNVSMALVLFHFIVPFFWTMSRNFKRNVGRLQIGATIILVMHVVDMYWFIMPNYHLGKPGFSFHWMDIACLLANVGIFGGFIFNRMTQHALVPVGDPRLQRSLHFQNA